MWYWWLEKKFVKFKQHNVLKPSKRSRAGENIGKVQSECSKINSAWMTWDVRTGDKGVCLSIYPSCFTDSWGNKERYNFTFSVPKHFNYIFFQLQQFSNQGADIDACVDKAANIQNEINKDFEQRVTANFAQFSASNSGQCNNRIFYNCFLIQKDFYDAFMFVYILVSYSKIIYPVA